jgi:hypothetical protein
MLDSILAAMNIDPAQIQKTALEMEAKVKAIESSLANLEKQQVQVLSFLTTIKAQLDSVHAFEQSTAGYIKTLTEHLTAGQQDVASANDQKEPPHE